MSQLKFPLRIPLVEQLGLELWRFGDGEAELLEKTSTMAFAEGSVFDDSERQCAHATGTFNYLRSLPTSGRQSKALQRVQAGQDFDPTNENDA